MLAWHYTIGTRAETIMAGGFILPATLHVPTGEKPIVWFSTRQDWEPSATKGIADARGVHVRSATMEEMIALGGLWRFGLASSELLPWGRLKEAARIRRRMLEGLLSVARKAGADPYDWHGSLQPVPVERCTVQCRLTLDSEWSVTAGTLRKAEK